MSHEVDMLEKRIIDLEDTVLALAAKVYDSKVGIFNSDYKAIEWRIESARERTHRMNMEANS